MKNLRQLIFDKLEDNSRKYPDKKAIEWIDGFLTYQELYNIVNSRAYYFIKELKNTNMPVAIRLKDKKEVLITIFALIRAGKTILPLPYEIPDDKATIIIKDIHPQALISEHEIEGHTFNEISFIDVKKLHQLKGSEITKNIDKEIVYHNENIFCVLMTSGTTGTPKGCQLSDQAFLGRISDVSEYFPMLEGDKFLFSGNYSFDVTFTQMFCWIFGEGTLVIQSERDKFNKIPFYIEKFDVTHIAISPAILRHIYDELKENSSSLKYIFVGGEKFPVEIAEDYSKEKAKFELWNLYGPTEFSIYATKFAVLDYKKEKNVSIGTPLKGVKVYLIDEQGSLIEESNVEGEIILSGEGMFNGYINNLEENNKKIIEVGGQRAYKTGDIGYYANGQYYLVGRKDHQFKINGVRVEAEEIENKILQYNPIIREVVVSNESYNQKNILVAYISWKNNREIIENSQIIKNVEKGLEKSFLPKFIVVLDEMPLNKNGKIDREVLRKIFLEKISNNFENYSLKKEKNNFSNLKKIWESILGVTLKDENTDFFLSGGDSIDCVVLMTEIEDTFGITLSEEEIIGHSSFNQLLSLIITKKEKSRKKYINKDSDIDWSDLGECIKENNGIKTLIGNGNASLYELVNSSLSIHKQFDKIFIMENDEKLMPQVIREFPLFSRQEFYIRKSFDSILQSTLTFDFPNYSKLFVALNKFIKNQQLTRSLIINHKFVEFDYCPIGPKNLEFIDLILLQRKEADRLLSEKIKNIHDNLLRKSPNKQMIQFLLVRESFNKAKLYLFVSHHIADGSSINIFKNQLLAYYHNNEEYNNIPTYESFVNSVISLNNDEKIMELAKSDYYRDIKLANESFREFFTYDSTIRFDEHIFELTTKNREDRANQLFAQLARLVHQKTGAPTFAFQILKNLRNFANVDYKDIFADIHCSIYTTYHINNKEDENLFSKSEHDFKTIYEKEGIHIDYLTSSDKFVDNTLIPTFEETFLNINYLGEVHKEEVPILIKQLRLASEQLAKLHSNKVRFTCFSSGNTGYLIALGGISLKL